MRIFRWAFGIVILACALPLSAQNNPNCFSNLTILTNAPICAGQDLVLWTTPSPNGNVTYSWTGPSPNNRTSSSQVWTIPNAQPSDSGTYIVTLSNNACGQVTTMANITVNVGPVPPAPSITGNSATCVGQTFNMNAQVAPNYLSFQWYRNSVLIAGATSSSYSSALAGSYTVTGTDAQCTSPQSAPFVTTINAIPAAPSITGPASTCKDSGLTLNATAGFTSYQWSLNSSPIGGATSSSYVVAAATSSDAGNYTVTGTDANGCTSVASAPFNVTVPLCAPTVSQVTPPCGSLSGGLAVTISGGSFQPSATVTIGGIPAVVTSVTPGVPGTILATTGAGINAPASMVNVVVTNPDTQFGTLVGGMTLGVRGDANNNGVLSAADAGYLNNFFAGAGAAPAFPCIGGDSNGNGTFSAADAGYLNNYVAGAGSPPGP